MSAAFALLLCSFGAVGLWACTTDARAAAAMHPPPWLRRHGRWTACASLGIAGASAVIAFGPAAGAALLLCAPMLAGSLMVPLLGAWPRATLRASIVAAALSIPLSLLTI
jgi:hypothetical protein